MNLTGFRTVIFGVLVAVGPVALNYLGAVDWQTIGLSPGVSAIVGAIIIGLRAITSTPLGVSK